MPRPSPLIDAAPPGSCPSIASSQPFPFRAGPIRRLLQLLLGSWTLFLWGMTLAGFISPQPCLQSLCLRQRWLKIPWFFLLLELRIQLWISVRLQLQLQFLGLLPPFSRALVLFLGRQIDIKLDLKQTKLYHK